MGTAPNTRRERDFTTSADPLTGAGMCPYTPGAQKSQPEDPVSLIP